MLWSAGNGIGPTPCSSGVADLEHGANALGGRSSVAGVAPHHPAHLAQVQLLGNGGPPGGTVMEGEEPVQLARRARAGTRGRQRITSVGLLERPERRPADHRADRVRAEAERGDDAEVAAAAADRPEELGVLVGARA